MPYTYILALYLGVLVIMLLKLYLDDVKKYHYFVYVLFFETNF